MMASISQFDSEQHEHADPSVSPLTQALRTVLNSYGDLSRHLAHQLQLGPNDVTALESLVRRPDLGATDLASLLGITSASVTVLLDRLQTAGHVERLTHPQDRRRKRLVVTKDARADMLEALQPIFEMHNAIDEHYTQEEQAIIESYLRRVSHSYDEHSRPTKDPAPATD